MPTLGMPEHVTLMRPDPRDPTAPGISSGFPTDLLRQSAGRLRILALLYAFVFFMAGIFPALLFKRAHFLGSFLQWGPGVIGIVVALLVAAVIRSERLPLPTVPPALDDLVLSCLAKDPAKRPQSARELSLRLADVDGANEWTQERARDWWMTHQPAPAT